MTFPPGTLHYAAPEVLARRSLITTARQAAKADIHSLGMVLFEMLMWQRYGRDVHGPADEAHDREEWFSIQRDYEIADEPRPTGSYLELVPAPELMDVIRRAISEGSLRYDSAEELRADLAAAADDTYGTFRREADVDARAALAASLESLVAGDVRESLILTFDSGAHVRLPHADGPRRFALMPTGLRLTHIGHPMPTSLTLDGTHVPFDSDEDFVDLDLALTYGEATPPSPIEVCVTYPNGSTFSWSLSFGPADRDWEWFKRPDWT